MKKVFTICFALLTFLVTEAQKGSPYIMRYVPYNGSNPKEFSISHIISDYGPRNVPPPMTFWHRGIDYQPNKQEGNKILSPCNGIIRRIRKYRQMFYMVVEGDPGEKHFGYAHLFRNVNIAEGQFWEEGPNGKEMAIYRENEDDYIIINMDPTNRYALAASSVTRETITYKGIPYNIKSNVTPLDPLAILGDSGASGRIHLHLYAYRDIEQAVAMFQLIPNCYDPMSIIDYEHAINNMPTQYSLTFQEHEINYGNSNNSFFKVQVNMNGAQPGIIYTDAVMDADLVELFISPEYAESEPFAQWGNPSSSYQYYKGEYYESKIDHGGRGDLASSVIYPSGITKRDPPASPSNTKIQPHAYSDATGLPLDNYFYSDFYPRIDENHPMGSAKFLAPHNLKACYPDGNYQAHIRMTSSKGNSFSSSTNDPAHALPETLDFQIDNFVPFVQKVEITQADNDNNYMRQWNATPSGSLVLSPLPNVSFEQQNLQVEITASEAMSEVELNINDYSYTATTASNLEQTIWEFNVPANALQLHAFNELQIGGKDVHGNLMQKDANQIPIRQSAAPSVFSPPLVNGYDENHKVYIGQQDINFTFEPSGSQDLTVQFFPESPHTIFAYSWDFGDGTLCNQPPGDQCIKPVHTYNTEGVYYVKLIINGNENYQITKEVSVQHLTAPVAGFLFVPRVVTGRDEDPIIEVDFYNNSEGIVNNYVWDFGNGVTSFDENPQDIEFEPNFDYNISLTVSNGIGNDYEEKHLNFDPATMPWADIVAWQLTDNLWDFDVSAENLEPPYSFTIEYGDGLSQTLQDVYHKVRFNHYYTQYGTYQVEAFVTGINPNTGHEQTVYDIEEVIVQPDDILVSLVNETNNDAVYPYTDVILRPVLYNLDDFNESTIFTETYSITKVGEPSYYEVITQTNFGPSFPERKFQFESAGEYQIQLYIAASGFPYGGNAEARIVVENAPKFLQASICCNPFTICQGAQNTYYAQIEPIGDPGWPEEYWYPTNVRWSLFDSQGVRIDYKEETFEYDEYYFNTLYYTYTYDVEDTYVLRLETWNNSHNYGELLDPKYNNTISFYAFDEQEIVVSPNMAALEIITDNYAYFTFDAEGEPTGSNQFTIKNPGLKGINWQVIIPVQYSNWISVAIPSGTNLVNSSVVNYVYTTASVNDETQYGYFNVVAYDEYGAHVQGSPASIQVEQWGVSGPGAQLVVGTNIHKMFGYSVSIDGKTAVIGAPGKNANDLSSVFIYQNNHIGVWENTAELIPPANQKHFGIAVAIHGEYIIVSGSWNAAIYKKPTGGWIGDIYPIKVLEDNGIYTQYEKSVSIWGDYAIVGDKRHNDNRGSVYVYYRNQGGPDQWGRQKLIEGTSSNDFFGTSVSVYGDLMAVGAPQQNINNGYIDVFYRNESLSETWSLEQRLTIIQNIENVKFGNVVSVFENKIATTYRSEIFFHTGILYTRSNNRNWGYRLGKDFRSAANDDSWIFNVKSIALYKEFDEIPDPFAYTFRVGCPDLHDKGGWGYGFSYKNSHIWNDYVLDSWHSYPSGILNLEKNDNFGNSWDISYFSETECAPGYQDKGAVIFWNKNKKRDLCDAKIDLHFENFTKPAGQYESVIAQNISIGGNTMPAEFQSGSDISYIGEEIVLKDGFLALEGAVFKAVAEDCYVEEEENKSFETEYDPEILLSLNSDLPDTKSLLDDHENYINIHDIYKQLLRKYPDLPLISYDFFNPENSIGIYGNDFEAPVAEANIIPELVIDRAYSKDGHKLILTIGENEMGQRLKFLLLE